MDDAPAVRRIEGVRDLPGDDEGGTEGQGSGAKTFFERVAINQFEDDGVDGVGALEAIDRPDVRVIERREEARLALKALEHCWIVESATGQNLEGDVATQSRIASAIDLAHASLTDPGLDAVWANEDPVEARRLRVFARFAPRGTTVTSALGVAMGFYEGKRSALCPRWIRAATGGRATSPA